MPRPVSPSVEESVVAPVTPSVPANEPLPPVRVPTDATFAYKFVELAVVVKNEVDVACVSVTFPLKVLTPLQVFVLASNVEDAAVIVTESPRAKFVPLIVPKEPLMSPEPIVVVETTRPFESVERSADVSEVSQVEPVLVNCVVLARVALKSPTTVEEACETNPEVNVARLETLSVEERVVAPVTSSVLENVPVPPVKLPIVALLEKRDVEVAVPKYPVPLAVNAVVDA